MVCNKHATTELREVVLNVAMIRSDDQHRFFEPLVTSTVD